MKGRGSLSNRKLQQAFFAVVAVYFVWIMFFSGIPDTEHTLITDRRPKIIPQGNVKFSHPKHCFRMGSSEPCYEINSEVLRNPCFDDPTVEGTSRCLPFFSFVGFPSSYVPLAVKLLGQHPDVDLPSSAMADAANHNSGLLDKEGVSLKAYASSFPVISSSRKITGEIGLSYANEQAVPAKMKELVPHVRIIIMLRDPLYSLYEYHSSLITSEFEKLRENGRLLKERVWVRPFDEFVRNHEFTSKCFQSFGCGENGESWNKDCTVNCRRYGNHVHVDWLQKWFSTFSADQILVIRAEDLDEDPVQVMRAIESHLYLNEHNYDLSALLEMKENRGLVGDLQLLHYAPRRTAKPKVQTMDYRIQNPLTSDKVSYNATVLDFQTETLLRNFFKPHIERLEILLKRKLNYPMEAKGLKNQDPNAKKHCFKYDDETNACYTIDKNFKNPCFYVKGERKCVPYFNIIGWPKSGTSSIYYYLTQHPYVLAAEVKETDYFEHWINIDAGPAYYASLFKAIRHPETITGEATSKYGHDLRAPVRMFEMLPHAKLIVMVRDPVEQLYSDHLMYSDIAKQANGHGLEPFDEWVQQGNWDNDCFKNAGCNFRSSDKWKPDCTFKCMKFGASIYVDWLQRWFEIYPREQFMILQTEELRDDPWGVMEKLRNFLGLPEHDWSNILSTVVNVRGEQRGIYSVVKADMYNHTRKIGDEYPAEIKLKMIEFFHPHNQRLSKLLGRELPGWWTPEDFRQSMKDSGK